MARRLVNRNMRLFKTEFVASPDFKQMVREASLTTDELIFEVLEQVRKDLLRFLKGYTDVVSKGDYRAQFGPLFKNMKAPDRNKVEWSQFAKWWNIGRPTHPGGWADITMTLVKSYKAEVVRNGEADYTLTLDNTADHAKYVEAMAGFFVVGGVMDEGGYVHSQIVRTFRYVSRRPMKGPRGGRKLGPETVSVGTGENSISATGI